MLQCSGTFVSCDRSPVTRGRLVAKYPLRHGLGKPGIRSGLCWLYPNLTSRPLRSLKAHQKLAGVGKGTEPRDSCHIRVRWAREALDSPADSAHQGVWTSQFARHKPGTETIDDGIGVWSSAVGFSDVCGRCLRCPTFRSSPPPDYIKEVLQWYPRLTSLYQPVCMCCVMLAPYGLH